MKIRLTSLIFIFPLIVTMMTIESPLASKVSESVECPFGAQPVYKKIIVPQELTYSQVRKLKCQEIVVGSSHLKAENKETLSNHLPADWRAITHKWNKSKRARLVKGSAYTTLGDDPSTYTATYSFPNEFEFSIMGWDEQIRSAVFIEDLDAEIAELDQHSLIPTLSTHGYDHFRSTHLMLCPSDLVVLQQRMLSGIALQLAQQPELIEPASNALLQAILYGGKHIFSFIAKPLIKKHVPYANIIYPQIDGLVKLLGYPTVTHFLSDLASNGGKLSSPLLTQGEEHEKTNPSQAIMPRNEKLHATSRVLGHAISFIPYASGLRTAGTMYVTRKGYPTITHWAMGAREMTDTQIDELRTSQTKLAEESVAMLVETFVPYGNVLVALSYLAAEHGLGESSMTAFAIHQLEKIMAKKKV